MRTSSSLARPCTVLALLATLAVGCGTADPARDLDRRRAQYSATVGSFVVRDEPAEGRQEILLDVLLQFSGNEPLAGITVDVSVADAAGREKASRKIWVSTAGVARGVDRQVTVTLDDVPYQPGDGFFVEVRSPIPAAERGAYREFGGAAGEAEAP
jgi:hypothetical protein